MDLLGDSGHGEGEVAGDDRSRRAETPVRGPRRCREPLVQAALS